MADLNKLATDLQVLKNEVEQVASVNTKLDNAIDKLTDISGSIKSMLAVHEEKLSQSEKLDEIIFQKLKDRQEDSDKRFGQIKEQMDLVEKRIMNEILSMKNAIGSRVNVLEKWKYLIIGGSIVIGFILARNFPLVIEMIKVS